MFEEKLANLSLVFSHSQDFFFQFSKLSEIQRENRLN